MSGSSESNEELVAGRVNRANEQTTIWAENRYTSVEVVFVPIGEYRIDYGGKNILRVEVAGDSENEEGEFRPPNPLDAIVGVGWSTGVGVIGVGGLANGFGVYGEGGGNGIGVLGDGGGSAEGVTGLGGPEEGTGVFGLGSGGERLGGPAERLPRRDGIAGGGIGVHGTGGNVFAETVPQGKLPGAGVLGRGGTIITQNSGGFLLGPGVIGIGGGGEEPVKPIGDAGSAGVFGQGAAARMERVDNGGMSTFVGPAEAGAGVIGRGGLTIPPEFPVGAGVIGLAGGRSKPPIAETGETGVYGLGRTGVHARGGGGPGLRARSDHDRGGVFESEDAAQIQLVPHRVWRGFETPERGIVPLPKSGQGGDLMTLIDADGSCTLWFCVRGSAAGPARWSEVLLGPAFDGQA